MPPMVGDAPPPPPPPPPPHPHMTTHPHPARPAAHNWQLARTSGRRTWSSHPQRQLMQRDRTRVSLQLHSGFSIGIAGVGHGAAAVGILHRNCSCRPWLSCSRDSP